MVKRMGRVSIEEKRRAATKIQQAYRKHATAQEVAFMEYKQKVVVSIQRIARGYIVRTSDKYTLAQLYMKLPPFWREVMKIKPVSMRSELRGRIQSYQVSDLKAGTTEMLSHILNDVVRDRTLPPKLPFVVPQPFDKDPYVSLADGRRLNYKNLSKKLLSEDYIEATKDTTNFVVSEDSLKYFAGRQAAKDLLKEQGELKPPREPIHSFNLRFWPITQKPNKTDTSTVVHDPYKNSFDLICNKRTTLSCEVCRTRLRIIQCKTCIKGYCFYCAFRTHTQAFKRNHEMTIMEPRVIEYKEVQTSLVYHIDMAQSVGHDLTYLIKYMRSASEVKRIQREKQMMKEFEAQEEARRLAFLRAQEEMKEYHQAATKINCMYRVAKAKRIVKGKRLQLKLESALADEGQFMNATVCVQRTMRMASVRAWLHRFGKDFDPAKLRRRDGPHAPPHKKKRPPFKFKGKPPPLTSDKVALRLERDARLRTAQARQNLLTGMERQHAQTRQLLEANIVYWHKQYAGSVSQVKNLTELRDRLFKEHKLRAQEATTLNLSAGAGERERRDLHVKTLHLKLEAAQARLENARNTQWWMVQHLRYLHRKLSIVSVRFQDTLSRLEWVSVEFAILGRMEFHMQERIKRLRLEIREMHPVADWVEGYLKRVVKQQILLDSLQETILREEINRLVRDDKVTVEFDSLVEELLSSIAQENQYIAEKVALDVDLKKEVYGSQRGIELNEQLIVLKNKMKTLAGHTIDALKAGLQQKYDDEDELNLQSYGFPNDNPDLPVDQLSTITAALVEPFSPGHHCKLADFLQVYLVQPWLAEQSVEDVRFEEQIATKELAVGTLRERLKAVRTQAKDNEAKKTSNEKRIRAITQELNEKMDGREGEGESEMKERLQHLELLRKEKAGLETEISLVVSGREDLAKQEQPLISDVAKVADEIGVIQDALKHRVEVRNKQSKLFFDVEKKACEELALIASRAAVDSEHALTVADKHLQLCQTYSAADEVIQGLIDNKNIDLDERVPINVPLQTRTHAVQALYHEFRPRTTPSPVAGVRCVVQVRQSVIETNRRYFEAVKAMYDTEVKSLQEFESKRAYYEDCLARFNKFMVNSRRQRALQKDIDQRKVRLEALRDLRLQSMQAAKERQLAQDKERATKQAEKEAAKKSMVKVLAQKTKQTIRDAQDAIRDLRYQNDIDMDEEEQRMARNLREKAKEGVGSAPEAIRDLRLTVGREETEFFQRQQDHLQSKGLPFFRRMQRSLGNQIYLWMQTTKDSSSFINHFELGHPDEGNPHYKAPQLRKKHYMMVDCSAAKLQLWFRPERRRDWGIKNIQLSFTEEEENRLIADKYSKIDTSLNEFGLPDTFLWIEKVDKVKAVEIENTNKIIAELKKVKGILDEKPDDRNVQAVVDRLGRKLEAAYAKEKKAEVTNPLQAATDLLALSEAELAQWMRIFQLIDKKRTSRVSMMDLFEYFEETPTPIAKEVFLTSDVLDREGLIEFGDFVRACGIFCLFGKKEVIQFMYVYMDKDRSGFISGQQFNDFMEMMHPYEKLRVRRVLKQLNYAHDYQIDFKEFYELNDRFPAAYSPMFNLQNAIRKKTMGVDWWFGKLDKYHNVRRKMGAEGGNVAQRVEVELQRFTEDELREKRMAEREKKIKQEPSEFRKVYLQAAQLLDEFS